MQNEEVKSRIQESELRIRNPEEKKICESGFSLIFWLLDSGFWILLLRI
jgi:hypothetical protein